MKWYEGFESFDLTLKYHPEQLLTINHDVCDIDVETELLLISNTSDGNNNHGT